jgi:16S rRNA (adenine1518-N6/adenine1519-N6)-dimethyltransferase
MHILETRAEFDSMVLMMQREVAERLAATPGGRKSGAITLKVQYYCQVEDVLDVPPDAFLPPPEVHSRVLRFTRRDVPPGEEPRFFRLVEAGFMHRRKTLPNAMLGAGLPYSREQIEHALISMNLPVTSRAEQLGVPEFTALQQQLDAS